MKNILSIAKGSEMVKTSALTLPEIGLIGGTRALLGAGAALLLADRFNLSQRKAIGWTLLLVGAATTLPLLMNVLSKRQSS